MTKKPEQADPAVHDERLGVGHREVAVAKQLEREHRRRGARLVHDERDEERRARPAACPTRRDQTSRAPAARSARTRSPPARTRRARRRSSRCGCRACRGRGPGTATRASTRATITSGTLMMKIHRHEAESTIWPPMIGPARIPIPPHAVHVPIAPPRSSLGKTDTMMASAAGVSSAPETPCSARADDEDPDRRRRRAQRRADAEPGHAGGEHPSLAQAVGQRAGEQDERAQRQQVGVGDPLLGGEPAAEVATDRRQRHVDGRRVHRGDRRGQDGGDEGELLGPRARLRRAISARRR